MLIPRYIKRIITSLPSLRGRGKGEGLLGLAGHVGLAGLLCVFLLLLASCARMGRPDGGWYDETPPRVIGASPADGGVNVTEKKVHIYFDEFIKLDNAT